MVDDLLSRFLKESEEKFEMDWWVEKRDMKYREYNKLMEMLEESDKPNKDDQGPAVEENEEDDGEEDAEMQ